MWISNISFVKTLMQIVRNKNKGKTWHKKHNLGAKNIHLIKCALYSWIWWVWLITQPWRSYRVWIWSANTIMVMSRTTSLSRKLPKMCMCIVCCSYYCYFYSNWYKKNSLGQVVKIWRNFFMFFADHPFQTVLSHTFFWINSVTKETAFVHVTLKIWCVTFLVCIYKWPPNDSVYVSKTRRCISFGHCNLRYFQSRNT